MLDAVEPLLLGGGDELAVDDERGSRVAVVGVETEDRRHGRLMLVTTRAWARIHGMRARSGASALVRQPWNVLVPLVFLQWLLLLLLTRRIEHDRWLFTQDGAGTYFWSTAWSFAHGHLPPPLVGFAWPLLLTPLAAVRGANYLDALPVLVLLQTLVVLPLMVVTVYGVASRIGGRWLGYLGAAGWILIPYAAVAISSGGYRPAFEGILLPQGLGLTGAGALPGTACVLAAAYFAVSRARQPR